MFRIVISSTIASRRLLFNEEEPGKRAPFLTCRLTSGGKKAKNIKEYFKLLKGGTL